MWQPKNYDRFISLLEKPDFLEPCNHCGICCKHEVCHIGKLAFGANTPAPCPGILVKDDKVFCVFIMAEKEGISTGKIDEPRLANALGIGVGCDTIIESDSKKSKMASELWHKLRKKQ